jgi:hypothetical protein
MLSSQKNSRYEHRFVVVLVHLPTYASGRVAESIEPRAVFNHESEATQVIRELIDPRGKPDIRALMMLARLERDPLKPTSPQLFAIFRYDRRPSAWEMSPEGDITIQRLVTERSRAEQHVQRLNALNGSKRSIYFWKLANRGDLSQEV